MGIKKGISKNSKKPSVTWRMAGGAQEGKDAGKLGRGLITRLCKDLKFCAK